MRRFLLLVIVFLLVFVVGCKSEKPVDVEPVEKEKETQEITEEEANKADKKDVNNGSLEPMVKEDKELAGAFIVAIDNHRNAYPQSGLHKADRVYELLAEGGITRYLAIFHSRGAEKIGPIRSARYYFAYVVKGHDLPFAHAGGNTDALNLIPQLKIKDMDEIYNAGTYFWRDKSRKMPHNLYTSAQQQMKGIEAKKYKMEPLKPLALGKVEGGEAINLIDITYFDDPRYLYTVTYEWDESRYKRYINGKPHKTIEDIEIFTENVIVMEAKTREIMKEELQSDIELIGSGKALFFTDGKGYEGSWKKENASAEFSFVYQGKPMKFSGEHAWINIVPSLNAVKQTNTGI